MLLSNKLHRFNQQQAERPTYSQLHGHHFHWFGGDTVEIDLYFVSLKNNLIVTSKTIRLEHTFESETPLIKVNRV